jgi:DNA-binding NarL/FixJ family response regulator
VSADGQAEDRQDLSARWQILAVALATGATVKAAARKAGVSERTVYRRLSRPRFRAVVRQLREQMTSEAIGTLTREMNTAAIMLKKLLKAGKDETRLRAARAIIELAIRAREHADLEQRVAELEEAVRAKP